jgi:hypothetical protein
MLMGEAHCAGLIGTVDDARKRHKRLKLFVKKKAVWRRKKARTTLALLRKYLSFKGPCAMDTEYEYVDDDSWYHDRAAPFRDSDEGDDDEIRTPVTTVVTRQSAIATLSAAVVAREANLPKQTAGQLALQTARRVLFALGPTSSSSSSLVTSRTSSLWSQTVIGSLTVMLMAQRASQRPTATAYLTLASSVVASLTVKEGESSTSIVIVHGDGPAISFPTLLRAPTLLPHPVVFTTPQMRAAVSSLTAALAREGSLTGPTSSSLALFAPQMHSLISSLSDALMTTRGATRTVAPPVPVPRVAVVTPVDDDPLDVILRLVHATGMLDMNVKGGLNLDEGEVETNTAMLMGETLEWTREMEELEARDMELKKERERLEAKERELEKSWLRLKAKELTITGKAVQLRAEKAKVKKGN